MQVSNKGKRGEGERERREVGREGGREGGREEGGRREDKNERGKIEVEGGRLYADLVSMYFCSQEGAKRVQVHM